MRRCPYKGSGVRPTRSADVDSRTYSAGELACHLHYSQWACGYRQHEGLAMPTFLMARSCDDYGNEQLKTADSEHGYLSSRSFAANAYSGRACAGGGRDGRGFLTETT